MFDNINYSLFSLVHAGPGLAGWRLTGAVAAAEWLILLVPATLVMLWLRGTPDERAVATRAAFSIALALLANAIVALAWFQQRPFVVGLAENVLQHDADSSFPSDHATIMFTMGLVLVSSAACRGLGVVLTIAAMLTAWARVYVGVHYPLDMAGAGLMAALIARLSMLPQAAQGVKTVLAVAVPLYRRIFAEPIRRGWVRP